MKRNLKNQSGKEDGFWVMTVRGYTYRGHYDNGKMTGIWECISKKPELVFRGTGYSTEGRASGLWKTYKADCYNSFFVYANHHNKFSSGPNKRKFQIVAEVVHIL